MTPTDAMTELNDEESDESSEDTSTEETREEEGILEGEKEEEVNEEKKEEEVNEEKKEEEVKEEKEEEVSEEKEEVKEEKKEEVSEEKKKVKKNQPAVAFNTTYTINGKTHFITVSRNGAVKELTLEITKKTGKSKAVIDANRKGKGISCSFYGEVYAFSMPSGSTYKDLRTILALVFVGVVLYR